VSTAADERPRPPGPANDWHLRHVERLLGSFERLTGGPLSHAASCGPREIFHAPFVLVSHGTEPEPLFNYGNRAALALFELDWDAYVRTPSRESAEPAERGERERLMQRVREFGFIDDYSGVRIASTGRRFVIERATVWNVFDEAGRLHGQAATFSDWRPV
jgi:hypothetical protein